MANDAFGIFRHGARQVVELLEYPVLVISGGKFVVRELIERER